MTQRKTTNWQKRVHNIADHGKIVATYLWGWVNTLVGPDSDFVYKYRGRYFVVTFDREMLGPHRTLQDLLQQEELLRVTPDTLAITCTELTADQLLPYLHLDCDDEVLFTINCECWLATSGQLRRQSTNLDPKYAYPWNDRGMRYADLGRYQEALAAYRQAIDLDPDNRHSYYNMACAYALMGDPAQACNWLAKTIDLYPEVLSAAQDELDFNQIRDDPRFQALMADLTDSEEPKP